MAVLNETEEDLQGLLQEYERISSIKHFKYALSIRRLILRVTKLRQIADRGGNLTKDDWASYHSVAIRLADNNDPLVEAFLVKLKDTFYPAGSVERQSAKALKAEFQKAMDLVVFNTFVPDDVRFE
jgi:hypothetical protein